MSRGNTSYRLWDEIPYEKTFMDLSPNSESRKFLSKEFQRKYNELFHKWVFLNFSIEHQLSYKTSYYQNNLRSIKILCSMIFLVIMLMNKNKELTC